MIRFHGRAVVYGEVWFDEEVPRDADVDIVVHRQRQAPILGAHSVRFLTLRTDLCGTEDAIFGRFHETCRYQIRRTEARDGLRHILFSDTVSKLDEFADFYDAFARQRSLWPCDRARLAAASGSSQLALSAALRGDETLAWHAYLLAGRCTRLEHSASRFRDKDPGHRALIGRANRWLHWKDMIEFRKAGFECYDWGGMFEDESTPERAGINRFKQSFGGLPVRSYDCTVPLTVKGRLWIPLRNTWRRWNTPRPAGNLIIAR